MEPGSRRPDGPGAGPTITEEGYSEQGSWGSTGSAPEAVGIEVIVADAGWRRFLPRAETLARRAARAALAAEGAEGSVTVLLTDDREVKRLNAEHRGKEKPTNVLSFPSDLGHHGGEHLGDIALALGVVRREARSAGKRPAAHLAHLVAHGTLHLLGHDHLSAGEARAMEGAEARIMARLRLPNPWKQPVGRAAP